MGGHEILHLLQNSDCIQFLTPFPSPHHRYNQKRVLFCSWLTVSLVYHGHYMLEQCCLWCVGEGVQIQIHSLWLLITFLQYFSIGSHYLFENWAVLFLDSVAQLWIFHCTLCYFNLGRKSHLTHPSLVSDRRWDFLFWSNERVQRKSAAECVCVSGRSSFPAETCRNWENMSALVQTLTETSAVLRK